MKTIFILNQACENALIDFPFHDNTDTWINDHKSLFDKIELIINNELYKTSESKNVFYINLFLETYINNK
jgi:hypothetical protein